MCGVVSQEMPIIVGMKAEAHPESSVPEMIICPVRRWSLPRPVEIWRFRELFFFLTWRDIKVRYKQTVLGVLWAFIQPFIKMVVFSIVFGRLADIDSGGFPYPVFLYAGLLPWEFFAEAVNRSGQSLVSGASLMKEVCFPRALLPMAAVGGVLVDFAMSFAILVGLMLYYKLSPEAGLLLVVPLTLAAILIALSVGLITSALNAIYRDFKYVLPFLVQIWMFMTPVVYPSSLVPARFQWVLQLNPMTGIIDGYRSAILGLPFDWVGLLVSLGVAFALLAVAWISFSRIELYLADVV